MQKTKRNPYSPKKKNNQIQNTQVQIYAKKKLYLKKQLKTKMTAAIIKKKI